MLFGETSLPSWMSTALVQVRKALQGRVGDQLLEDVFGSRGRGRQGAFLRLFIRILLV